MLVRLRMLHPAIAAAAGLYTAILATRLRQARPLGTVVAGLVVLQLGAGMVNLYLLAPVWMQLVHLLLADLLWIALVLLTAAVLEKSPARAHTPELVHR
jgi:heme A synthase